MYTIDSRNEFTAWRESPRNFVIQFAHSKQKFHFNTSYDVTLCNLAALR